MKKNKVYYDSARKKNPLLQECHALFRYRELLGILIINCIKTRYKRSSLGVLWTMLNPLLYMTVMVIAFSHIFRFQVENYPVYLLLGLIGWNFFSQSTTQAMHAVVWGGHLLKRVYVPRSILVVATVGAGIVNLLLSCIPLFFIMLLTHQPVYITWLFMPLTVLILAAVSLGAALLLSILAVFFNDTVELYQIGLQAMFYVTPIMYPETILPARLHPYLLLNPVYDVIKVFRNTLYEGHLPSYAVWLPAAFASFFILFLGAWLFTRHAEHMMYRI